MSNLTTLEQVSVWTGVICGIGGLALGGASLLHQYRETRPRLRVVPGIKHIGGTGTWRHNVGVFQVDNTGSLPVTIAMVGFQLPAEAGFIINRPATVFGEQLPLRLEPGRRCLVEFDLDGIATSPEFDRIKYAFVNSEIGEAFVCSRRAMTVFRKNVADYKRRQAVLE